ncbi:MAG: hypothetical protein LAO79_30070 [Acidobacteriia bacterium]|nr:hypothetical protein [Terriglobia bacterium]
MRAVFFVLLAGALSAQVEPPHVSGQAVTAAFEGWYANADGTSTILIGYYNRNLKEALEIPVGPNNRVEPGGPDRGQPTHFLPGRQWGVFTITVPKNFGEQQKLTWTIVANGKTTSIPFSLNPLWVISPFIEAAGNTPPFLGFAETGPFVQGPPRGIAQSLDASVGAPLPLNVWVSDDAKVPPPFAAYAAMIPMVSLTWMKFRGPGDVKFSSEKPKVAKAPFKAEGAYTGKSSATATFSAPGDYLLEVTANDISGVGGGGFQCCWTSAQVKVTVK